MLAIALAATATLSAPIVASAHAFLVQSDPSPGQRLTSSPTAISLRFSEAVVRASLRVNPVGRSVPAIKIDPPTRSSDGTVVSFRISSLTAGTYRVGWEVISNDGHPSDGEFAFGVGATGPIVASTSTSNAPTDWGGSATRWVFLFVLAVAAGALVSRRWVWLPDQMGVAANASRRLPIIALVIGSAAALYQLFLVGEGLRQFSGGLTGSEALSAILGARPVLSAVGAFVLVLGALGLVVFVRGESVALLFIFLSAGVLMLSTHPGTTGRWWAAAGIVIHVAVALLWLGLLTALVVVLSSRSGPNRWELAMAIVRRYSRLALFSALAVVLTGFLPLLAEIHRPGDLLDTAYGKLLLLKMAVVGVALLVAASLRLRALRRESAASLALVRRFTRLEAAALVVALGIASLLAGIAPPYAMGSSLAASLPSGPPAPQGDTLTLAGQAGWLEIYLTASSGQLVMTVIGPDDKPLQNPRFGLSVVSPTGAPANRRLRACGDGCVWLPFSWPAGTTDLTFQATSRNWSGGSLAFSVPWPPVKAAPELLDAMITTMQAQAHIVVDEHVSSGPNSSAYGTSQLSGSTFIEGEPYAPNTNDVHQLPSSAGLTTLVVYLPGSQIWVRLAIDGQHLLRQEVIVDPGHFIQRTFSYP